MAYDTIRVQSRQISEELATQIKSHSVFKTATDCETGNVLYQFTQASLQGSYDSRIMIQVKTERWVNNPDYKFPILEQCPPYLVMECSLHKIMFGHNVFGGSDDLLYSFKYLLQLITSKLNLRLPSIDNWYVLRIDYAKPFLLPNVTNVKEYIRGLKNTTYPRRQVSTFGTTGIYIKGSTTTLKFYHKGTEFKKHDYKKLITWYNKGKLESILKIANRILRVEIEIKRDKLVKDFGTTPKVTQIKLSYIIEQFINGLEKFLKEGEIGMNIVRSSQNVQQRLNDLFDSSLSGNLLGFWYQLTTLSEDYVKMNYKKSTFYKYRKLLKESGITWHNTDIQLKSLSLVPQDFSPLNSLYELKIMLSAA